MGIEEQGVMPTRPEDNIQLDQAVPEVPKTVTDGTLARQETAGDPLKEAATRRREEIRKTFPEVSDLIVGGAEKKAEERAVLGQDDPTLDERMKRDLKEQDVQNGFDRFTRR